MKNIIPFKKDVIFKTNISEITSISLENTLSINEDLLSGEFIINGEYKVSDKSNTVEPFEIRLPFEIAIDERYETKKALIDIDDFYYEIKNNNVLVISIDVLLDKLEEKPLIQIEDLVDVTPIREIIDEEEVDMKNENLEVVNKLDNNESRNKDNDDIENKINSIFNSSSFDNEVFVAYNVVIIREGASIDTIIEKYKTTEEQLKKYNDLSNLQLGDKLIIPNTYEKN